jgi:hypothetical protein
LALKGLLTGAQFNKSKRSLVDPAVKSQAQGRGWRFPIDQAATDHLDLNDEFLGGKSGVTWARSFFKIRIPLRQAQPF